MAFNPADYDARITLASGDFRTCVSSESPPVSGHWLQHALDANRIESAVESFIGGGASILITPTDGISALPEPGTGDDTGEALPACERTFQETAGAFRKAAARAASDQLGVAPVAVWGAIGPVEPLVTLNEVEEETLLEAFGRQATALKAGGVDAVICRGFSELEALVLAVRAVRESTSLPVIGGMTFDAGHDYSQTSMGVTIPQAMKSLLDAGACMIGCDGSEFPDGAPAIVSLLRASGPLPVYVEVTAGRAELIETGRIYPENPKAFGERLERLVEAGALIVGGGAGVSVAHLAEMGKVAARLKNRGRAGKGGGKFP